MAAPASPWGRSGFLQQGYGIPSLQSGYAPLLAPNFSLESAPQPVDLMPEGDLREITVWLGEFTTRAGNVVEEVKKLVKLVGSGEREVLVSCPYDSRHTMPAHALLGHWLRCSSSPADLSTEATELMSSLGYLRRGGEEGEEGELLSPTAAQEIWYADAPGPVRAPTFVDDVELDAHLPECVKAELENSVGIGKELPEVDHLLPSQFWILQKEVEGWADLPESYSQCVMASVTRLGTVTKATIARWLLGHSCGFGIVMDPVLASHVCALVKLFMMAARKEAAASFVSSTGASDFVRCPTLLESGNWLSAQVSYLYQRSHAKALVLELLKYVVIASARSLLAVPSKQGVEEIAPNGESEEELSFFRLDMAIRALRERKHLENYVAARTYFSNMPKSSYLQEYDILVKRAAEERLSRPNYKPLLEHDGLVWERQQEKEPSKSKDRKTKQELLAQERENKRRRMSYRGKKHKRSTTQVLHDIIERHMKDIVAAGGIGCFNKEAANLAERISTEEYKRGSVLSKEYRDEERSYRDRQPYVGRNKKSEEGSRREAREESSLQKADETVHRASSTRKDNYSQRSSKSKHKSETGYDRRYERRSDKEAPSHQEGHRRGRSDYRDRW